jgi:hypothetical protein
MKEYEQTLETVMNKFRTHAVRYRASVALAIRLCKTDTPLQQAASAHEQTLIRHYETLLLARQSQSNTTFQTYKDDILPIALERLKTKIRLALRAMSGDTDPEASEEKALQRKVERKQQSLQNEGTNPNKDIGAPDASTGTSATGSLGQRCTDDAASDLEALASALEALEPHSAQLDSHPDPNPKCEVDDLPLVEEEPDWIADRELQIAQLEAQNAALRTRLGIDPRENDWGIDENSWDAAADRPVHKLRGAGGSRFGAPKHSRTSSFGSGSVPPSNVWDDVNGRPGLGGTGEGILGGGREPKIVMAPFGVGITASNPPMQPQPQQQPTGPSTGAAGSVQGWFGISFGSGSGQQHQQQSQQQPQQLQQNNAGQQRPIFLPPRGNLKQSTQGLVGPVNTSSVLGTTSAFVNMSPGSQTAVSAPPGFGDGGRGPPPGYRRERLDFGGGGGTLL